MTYKIVNESTKCTPAHLMFAHELVTPVNLFYRVSGNEQRNLDHLNDVDILQPKIEKEHTFPRENLKAFEN